MNRQSVNMLQWGRYPAVRLALLYAFGILLSDLWSNSLTTWLLLLLLLTAVRWGLEYSMLLPGPDGQSARVVTYCLFILLFGSVQTTITEIEFSRYESVRDKIELFTEDTVLVKGKILRFVDKSSERIVIDVAVSETTIDTITWKQTYRARLVRETDLRGWNHQEEGDRVEFTAIIEVMDGPENPHQFDYRTVLYNEKIALQGTIIESRQLLKTSTGFSIQQLRHHIHLTIEKLYSSETVPFAKALLLGDRSELSSEQESWFRRSGLSHMMAVSGMHVGLLMAPFWGLLPWLRTTRPGRLFGLLAIVTILLLYALITRLSPSVCRATLMIGFLILATLQSRASHTANLLGLSALIILIVDPDQLYDIGFQLSYSAVGIIVLVYPSIRRHLYSRNLPDVLVKILSLFLLSLTIQLGLAPLLMTYFNAFSLTGPLANIVALPLLTVTIPAAFISLIVMAIHPGSAFWLGEVNTLPVDLIIQIARFFANSDMGWFDGVTDPVRFIPLWVTLILFIGTLNNVAMRWKSLLLVMIVVSGLLMNQYLNQREVSTMRLVLLDVGQGDAIYIRTPGGRNLLVDTGRWSPWSNSGQRVLVPYLNWLNVDKLDALIITHPHADHIGGVLPLLESIEVDTIYHNGRTYDSELYREFRRYVSGAGINEKIVKAGDMIPVDPSIRIFVLGPWNETIPSIERQNNSTDQLLPAGNDPNNNSVILKIVYNTQRFLLAGDAGKDQEDQLVSQFGDFLKSDFLKVAHHGSRTSSGRQFLNYVNPGIAAGSAADNSRFGHPHREAIDRLNTFTDTIFFTSMDDALIFESDGFEIEHVYWKQTPDM